MDFARVEAEFGRLKTQFERGVLTEAEFKAQLQELMIEDEQGRWWIIGYETGRWYVHDGVKWVQQEPPRATPSTPPTHPRHPGPSRPKVGLKLGRDGLSVLVITAGWLVCWGIAAYFPLSPLLAWVIVGGSGGLITGLVLRRTAHYSPWMQVSVVTIGWIIGMAISDILVPWGGGGGIAGLIAGAIIGLVGGFFTALALKRTQPSIQWKHVALVTLGWGSGWAVGGAIGWIPPAIGGAVGSWVMFGQISRARQTSP